MSDFIFNTTPSIRQIYGGSAELGGIVSDLRIPANGGLVLFVTDPGIVELGLAERALASLEQSGFKTVMFDGIEPDPKATTVLTAVEVAKEHKCTCVIGFGGGSSMDVAKLVALLANTEQPLDEMYGVNQVTGCRLPLILVPTTAGTGSEVTAVSILTTGEEEKKGVVSPVILPDIAMLDAELTVGLPPHITAATGIDAMVHAIEAFTSKSINNNPISRMLAKQALELLSGNIREAVFNGANIEARSSMLLGSMMAGQAFANSPVAAVHALAYPIGSTFHVPHGLSNALVLVEVMRFNASVCSAQYAELAPHIFPEISTNEPSQTVTVELIQRIASLGKDLGLEQGLRDVGIGKDDIQKLAEDAMLQTRLLVNNPREVGLNDALRIYEASY